MPKYEELNETQQRLYDDLSSKIYEEDYDIEPILKEALPDDLLNVFKVLEIPKAKNQKGKTILFTISGRVINNIQYMPKLEFKLASILKVAQDKGILKDVISMNTELILEGQCGDKKATDITKGSYPLKDFFIISNHKNILERLEIVKESCGLESFWKVISEDDCEMIKAKFNEDKHKNMLDTINEIEKSIAAESNPTEKSNTTHTTVEDNSAKEISSTYIKAENKPVRPTSKAIVASGICGAIAALAVGIGCGLAGVQLSILAFIGIAIATAVVAGLVAGGITYAVSKPSNELNEVDAEQEICPEVSVS